MSLIGTMKNKIHPVYTVSTIFMIIEGQGGALPLWVAVVENERAR